MMDIKTWFEEIGMGEHWEKFESNKIDEDTLISMTENDLKDIGIEALGDRKTLIAGISECERRRIVHAVGAGQGALIGGLIGGFIGYVGSGHLFGDGVQGAAAVLGFIIGAIVGSIIAPTIVGAIMKKYP